MSRFAIDPRWLIYLPPTMSRCAASSMDEWLERPEEAFAYYADNGIARVICEEKHMGSRAVVVLARDADHAARAISAYRPPHAAVLGMPARIFRAPNNFLYNIAEIVRIRPRIRDEPVPRRTSQWMFP